MTGTRLVVLISGNGSNLQAIIDRLHRPQDLPVLVAAVISNRADAFGLVRAARAGITNHVLPSSDYPDRQAYDLALMELIDRHAPDVLVLAGFMRILSSAFVNHYRGKIMNIHPSLLPKYPGLNTHERVLAEGDREHGASVHFVTEELDAGPLILQERLMVRDGDTAASLQQRVHQIEHRILPRAIEWYARGRIRLCGDRVLVDGTTTDNRTSSEAHVDDTT